MPTLLLSLILAVGQQSVAKPDHYIVYGPGVLKCDRWMIVDGEGSTGIHPDLNPFPFWLLGYVTGSAAVLSSRDIYLRETDRDTMVGWVTKYCQENPKKHISDAANQLVLELIVKKP